MQKLGVLRLRISQITSDRMNFEFDTDTNAFIDSIFYENSCKSSFSTEIFKE